MLLEKTHPNKTTPPPKNKKELTYALIGHPNSGKTTLFNHLTGLKQKVANYPGVTIEKKEGCCYSQHGERIHLIDLPGAYSLSAHSPDEEILQNLLLGNIPNTQIPDRLLCIIDASNLERTLYFALQIIELNIPTILVLNMQDSLEQKGLSINIPKLQSLLGIPTILIQANKKETLLPLKIIMSQPHLPKPTPLPLNISEKLKEAVIRIQHALPPHWTFEKTLLFLSNNINHNNITHHLNNPLESKTLIHEWRTLLNSELPQWRSTIIQARFQLVESIYKQCVQPTLHQKQPLSKQLDSILLHPLYGWITLITLFTSLFWTIFSLSEYPMNWIHSGINTLCQFLDNTFPQGPLKSLIINGAIQGVGSVLAFLPQIALLFLFIGILESTGYLPRAAFLLDKIMKKVGLPGKAFIPLLSSYACAIPGILATRTLPSRQDRLATILIAPWMSCSARLPIYLMIINILVPKTQYATFLKTTALLSIYLLGTLTALAIAACFKKTFLKGNNSLAIIELPPYHPPCWKNIFTEIFQRTLLFIQRAGIIILCTSIILWFLMSYPQTNPLEPTTPNNSYIGQIGHIIEPIIQPLGYDWKIGIGLITSFAARELFVSSITLVYENTQPPWSPLTCLSLLIFFIYAMQCASTLAVVYKETNSYRWPLFQLLYMTTFAYLSALLTYQLGLFLGFQ